MKKTMEHERLALYREHRANWKNWGPYLSERAWGTVREDYSHHGAAWDYFPHEHARSRVYRWNEDGLAGQTIFVDGGLTLYPDFRTAWSSE
jgi:hypothetical protein